MPLRCEIALPRDFRPADVLAIDGLRVPLAPGQWLAKTALLPSASKLTTS